MNVMNNEPHVAKSESIYDVDTPSNFTPEDEFNPCYHCKFGINIKPPGTIIKDEEIPEPCKACDYGFG